MMQNNIILDKIVRQSAKNSLIGRTFELLAILIQDNLTGSYIQKY